MNPYDALFHVTCENGTRFNYRTEKHPADTYNEIKNLTDLTDYFNGGMEYWSDIGDDEMELTGTREADWCFATNEFEEYIQDWMNNAGIDSVIGIIESGVYANGHELCFTNRAMEILIKHREHIEEILEESPDDVFTDQYGNFSFARLVVLAFEYTIKKWTIDALQVEPSWEGDQRYEYT